MTSSKRPGRNSANSLLETARDDPHAVSAAELVEVMVRGTPEARTVAAEAYAVVVAARPTVAASVASELRDSIADGDEDVRAGAARTVAHLADDDPEPFRETAEPLFPMLESPVELGRDGAMFAVLALSRRFPTDVEPGFSSLLRLLEAETETEPVEREPHIPGREPNPSGREFGHARAENDIVRFAAARTLRNVATERPETALEAVDRFGPLLDDRNADVRATACEVFAVIAEERTPAVRPQLGKLVELLVSDPEHPVPWKAASALAELTDEYPEAFADAVVGDADELALFLRDPDPDVRGLGVAFLSYLAEYHPEAVERASEPLRTLLTDENPLIRANAVRTLRTANAVSPADLREVAKNDPDPDVRDVAATAVRRLRRQGEQGSKGSALE